MDSQTFVKRESVVRRDVAGETFLVPIHGHLADLQELFVLNEVGGWLWERLDGKHGLDELADRLCADFDVDKDQALSDTQLFVERLVEAGLAEESGTGRS